jgi:hypothetical protein
MTRRVSPSRQSRPSLAFESHIASPRIVVVAGLAHHHRATAQAQKQRQHAHDTHEESV